MKARFIVKRLSAACAALLILTSCGSLVIPGVNARTQPTTRILFIGNSYTAVNGGIDKQLSDLDPSSETARIDNGGYTLQNHWNDGNALQQIRNSKWNYVVLQEQSQTAIFDQNKFRTYAAEFDKAIKSSGAKTILLMTWERPDSATRGVTTVNLAAAFSSVGKSLGAQVAPAGLAFARVLRDKPDLVLYSQDGHPTTYGTFLAACVVYVAIFGHSPVGNAYSDSAITPELRTYFEQVATQTIMPIQ